MLDSPTPGQVAYAAYCVFWCRQGLGERALLAWSTLTPEMHEAWEAAAQAVLDAGQTPPRQDPLPPDGAPGQAPLTVLELYEAMGEVAGDRTEEPPHA